jgi:peptidoglycan/LPS O-acetylase OafA/YrhL
MQSLERNNDSPLSFYTRRVFRIYPLSVLAVVFMLGVSTPVEGNTPPYVHYANRHRSGVEPSLRTNLTVADTSLPYWSLPIEVQMYVLIPFLFLLTKKSLRFWIPVG